MANRQEPGSSADDWRAELLQETSPTAEAPAAPVAAGLRVPGLTLLFHPDVRRVGERAALPQLAGGDWAALSRSEPAFGQPGAGEERPLAERHLSRTPIRLRAGQAGGIAIERGESQGRVLVGGEELGDRCAVSSGRLDDGVVVVLGNAVALLLHRMDPLPDRGESLGLVGASAELARLRREIGRVTVHDTPVLLRGETGSGKELVARAIHQAGKRAAGPCVAINLAAIPASLAATELFGSAKGAFTGADRQQKGYFEAAEGGTLFLDEIGETPLDVQALLLRALESREIQPIGGRATRAVDVRIVAATDADLDAAVATGTFRAALLHRLAGYEIRIPPLRRRRDDVARLVVHFYAEELAKVGRVERIEDPAWLPLEVMASLAAYDWPGNVRQLRNLVHRLAILEDDPGAQIAAVAEVIGSPTGGVEAEPEPAAEKQASRRRFRPGAEVGDEELLAALGAHDWQPVRAAAALGISRGALYKLIDACAAVRKASELSAEEIAAARQAEGGDTAAMARRFEVSEQGLKRRMSQLDGAG